MDAEKKRKEREAAERAERLRAAREAREREKRERMERAEIERAVEIKRKEEKRKEREQAKALKLQELRVGRKRKIVCIESPLPDKVRRTEKGKARMERNAGIESDNDEDKDKAEDVWYGSSDAESDCTINWNERSASPPLPG